MTAQLTSKTLVVWGVRPDGILERAHREDRAVKQIRAKALAGGLRALGIPCETRPGGNWNGESLPSVSSGAPRIWKACLDAGEEFWAVDNGFWRAPEPGKNVELFYLKMSHCRPTPRYRADADPDPSRFRRLRLQPKPWRPNKHGRIILCPPRGGLAADYYRISEAEWIGKVREALPAKYRDRVKIRRKGDPGRFLDVARGAMAVVSQASRTALDALMEGIPSVETDGTVRDWNGLSPDHIGREDLCKSDRTRLFSYLAWCQFLLSEMRSGFAWAASFVVQCGEGPAREWIAEITARFGKGGIK